MFMEFSDHSEFGPLMTRMQVVDAHGDSKMDEEQWEAASESNAVVYHKRLANAATRHLHWIHLRKTIVISSSAFVFCSFRFALCSLLSLHSLLYIFITFRIIGHQPPPPRQAICTHVYVGVLRHFLQVVWIENLSPSEKRQPTRTVRKTAIPFHYDGGTNMKDWAYSRDLDR